MPKLVVVFSGKEIINFCLNKIGTKPDFKCLKISHTLNKEKKMKKTNVILGFTTILMMSAVPFASAADLNTNAKGAINFDAIDTDHDGVLTQTEFDTSSMFKGEKFNDLDKDDNGSIDDKELSVWAAAHGKGNPVGTVNTRNNLGAVGNINVPIPNVDTDVSVTGTSNGTKAGAGTAIGVKGNVSGTTQKGTSGSSSGPN
jgi:hypothetical protein